MSLPTNALRNSSSEPINAVVHLPKQFMCAGKFGAFSGGLRVRMHLGQWKVTEGELQLGAEILQYAFQDRMCGATMRAFVIAVFDQGHRGICRPLGVVMLRDRNP